MAAIHVLHENHAWTAPLLAALRRRHLPYRDWHLHVSILDLTEEPPAGIFYNRMSASSHTRGHRFAPELTAAVLDWLESHGRYVLNGGRALQLELSKVAQYEALRRCGIRTPTTIAAVGRRQIIEAGRRFAGRPFIIKHNRAGKELGVRLLHDEAALARYLESPGFELSVDGITLIQQYIEAPEPFITRVEFIGGELLYAARADAFSGFGLCPADASGMSQNSAPTTAAGNGGCRIIAGFDHPLLPRYRAFLQANDVHVAAFEFVTGRDGIAYTYDINTNTNYDPDAERAAGMSGMDALAELLGAALADAESGTCRDVRIAS